MMAVSERSKAPAKAPPKRNRVSYSLEPVYETKLKEIAELNRRSATQELRFMIDQRAAALGLEPVNATGTQPVKAS